MNERISMLINNLFFSENNDFSTLTDQRSLYRGEITDRWVAIEDLVPWTTYFVQVNASNTAGYVLSNSLTSSLPQGSLWNYCFFYYFRPPCITDHIMTWYHVLYSVQRTLYSVQCAVCDAHCTLVTASSRYPYAHCACMSGYVCICMCVYVCVYVCV